MDEWSLPWLVARAVDPYFEERFEEVFKQNIAAPHIILTESTNAREYVLKYTSITS